MAMMDITDKDLLVLDWLRNVGEPFSRIYKGYKVAFYKTIHETNLVSKEIGERIWDYIVDILLVEFIHRFLERFTATSDENGCFLTGDLGTDEEISQFKNDFLKFLEYGIYLCLRGAETLSPVLNPLPIDNQIELFYRISKRIDRMDQTSPEAYETLINFYKAFPKVKSQKELENIFAYEGRILRYRNLNKQSDIVLEEFHKIFKPEIDRMIGNWKKNISKRYGRNIDTSEKELSAAIYDVLHKVLFGYDPFTGDVENYFNAYATKEKIGYAKKEANGRLKLTEVPKSNDKKWEDLSQEEKEQKGREYFQFGKNHEGQIILETEMFLENEEEDFQSKLDGIGMEPINPALAMKVKKEYDNLPGDTKKIIKYHYFYGETFEKIAEIIGERPDSVRQTYHRAMQKLLKVYSETSSFFNNS